MAIDLVEKYLPYVDELFTTESKKELLTNKDFTFKGAHTVKIYKISTGKMNDYGRSYRIPGTGQGMVKWNRSMPPRKPVHSQKTVPSPLPSMHWTVTKPGILWKRLRHWQGRSGKW